MDTSPDQLLALATLQILGPVDVKDKRLKPHAEVLPQLVARGWVATTPVKVPTVTRTGRPGRPKTVEQCGLTESGKKFLADQGVRMPAPAPALPPGFIEEIRQAFADLTERLEALRRLVQPVFSTGTPGSVPSVVPGGVTVRPDVPLPEAIEEAYGNLKSKPIYKHGLVGMGELYHETRKRVSTLSREQFQDTVRQLRAARRVTIQAANAPAQLPDRDYGLWEGDKLYYYVTFVDR